MFSSSTLLKIILVAAAVFLATLAIRPKRSVQLFGAPQHEGNYPPQMYGGYRGRPSPPVVVQFQPPPAGAAMAAAGGGGKDCFPSDAVVLTPDGPRRMMDIVNASKTQVLVVDEKNQLFYSPILLWVHKSRDYAKYIEIETDSGERLVASRTHFVFRVSCYGDGVEKEAVFAQDICEKECVLVLKDGQVVPRRVVAVSKSYQHGRYQFLTKTGTVVVNNVVASTYSVIDDYRFQHQIFSGYYHIHKLLDRYVPYLAQMLDNDKKNYVINKMVHLLDAGTVF